MTLARLRWIIMTVSFFLLTFGGLYGLYLGNFLPTFSCNFTGQKIGGICYLYTLQDTIQRELWTEFALTFFLFSLLVIMLGPVWCGWFCPRGFLHDCMDWLRKKIGINYIRFPSGLRRGLSSLKWIFLIIAIPFWVAYPFFAPEIARDMRTPFCSLCPARYIMPIIGGTPERVSVDFSTTTALVMSVLGALITSLTIVGSFFKRRFFCCYCPMSLLISFYDKIGFAKLKKNPDRCTRCGICYNVCPMEIQEVFEERNNSDVLFPDCIYCLRCIEFCPEDDALYATYLGKTIYKSKRNRFSKEQKEFKG